MSDFMTSLIISLSCVGLILLFFFIWRKQFKDLKKVKGFIIVYIVLVIIVVGLATAVVILANDPNWDYLRKLTMWATVATLIWFGAWCSQYKMDKEEGIARKID